MRQDWSFPFPSPLPQFHPSSIHPLPLLRASPRGCSAPPIRAPPVSLPHTATHAYPFPLPHLTTPPHPPPPLPLTPPVSPSLSPSPRPPHVVPPLPPFVLRQSYAAVIMSPVSSAHTVERGGVRGEGDDGVTEEKKVEMESGASFGSGGAGAGAGADCGAGAGAGGGAGGGGEMGAIAQLEEAASGALLGEAAASMAGERGHGRKGSGASEHGRKGVGGGELGHPA
ncbi:unnamed protein product [Closterium sp. Naga37s-1]|nr:unnamed protein product [Closterium sp. Naga37s-1]